MISDHTQITRGVKLTITLHLFNTLTTKCDRTMCLHQGHITNIQHLYNDLYNDVDDSKNNQLEETEVYT